MPMYSLTVYSDKYLDTSGSLWQFKSHGLPLNNDRAPFIVNTKNSSSFKYKSSLLSH